MPTLRSSDLDHILSHTESLWAGLRGERIFVTGGTGFVGTWLIESLLWANRRLNLQICATVLTRNPAAYVSRAPHLACDPAVTLIAGDAASFAFPGGSFRLVVHAATEPYFPPDAAHPFSVFACNVAGTQRVLEFARRCRACRVLFTSSGVVYGKPPAGMTHIPEVFPGGPLTTDTNSAYAQSKRASEFLCAAAARVFGFDVSIARLFAFVGPHLPLDTNYAVCNFIRDVLAGGPVRISGDGTPYRSYLYAADLAIWLWTILLRAPSAAVYNVGSPHALTIADLARRVVDASGQGPIEILTARRPVPGVPAQRYVPDTARAEQDLGLRPWITLEEAIRRTCRWHAQMRIAGTVDAPLVSTTLEQALLDSQPHEDLEVAAKL